MDAPTELLRHLDSTLGIERRVAERLIEEVLAYYDEPPERFVVRRHAELQTEGRRNPEIFEAIRRELGQRRFPAPRLSLRQLRRIVYG